jgi:hypothetical protein
VVGGIGGAIVGQLALHSSIVAGDDFGTALGALALASAALGPGAPAFFVGAASTFALANLGYGIIQCVQEAY